MKNIHKLDRKMNVVMSFSSKALEQVAKQELARRIQALRSLALRSLE
jgi:hypothetical protein